MKDKLRAIGVSTTQRAAIRSDRPTLAESDVPALSLDAWIAVIGPTGLPQPVVRKYEPDINTVLAPRAVRDAVLAQRIAVVNNTLKQAAPLLKSEFDKYIALSEKPGATVV